MKRLVKWIFGTIVIVVLLLIGVAVAVPLLFDPNAHKPRIESLVEAQIGRKLSIEGDISLSLFPWLGFEVGKVTLGNAPGFDDAQFASVQNLQIRVRLLPLLDKQVEMDTVAVDGLSLRLRRTATGSNNWDDLATAGERPAADAASGPPPVAALAIGGVHLSNASIRFEDARAGQSLSFDNLSLITGPLSPGRPVQVQTEFDFAGGPPQAAGRIALAALLALDPGAKRYAADNFQISAALTGAAVPEGRANIEAKGGASFDANTQRLTLSGLDLRSDNPAIPGAKGNVGVKGDFVVDLASRDISAEGLSLRGDLTGLVPKGQARFELTGSARANLDSRVVAAPELVLHAERFAMEGVEGSLNVRLGVAGNLDERRFEFSGLAADGKFRGDALPIKGEVPLKFQAKTAAIDLGRERAAVDAFNLEIQALRSAGSVSATALLSKPRFSGEVNVARFDLRSLLAALGQPLPATADPETFKAASLSTGFKADLNSLALENLKASLDGTTISGKLTAGLGAAGPLRFDLSLDAMDADRYLPPKAAKAKATPAAAVATAITLPVDQLRRLDVEGRLRAGRLKVSGLRLEDVNVNVKASGGKIRLSPLQMALYGGRYSGNLGLDVSSDKPTVSLNEQVSGISLAGLLKDLNIDSGGIDFSGAPSSVRLKAGATGNLASNVFQFTDLSLDADLGGRSFPGNRLQFDVRGNATADLGKQTLTADPLAAKFGPVTALGKLAVTRFLDDPRYAASLKAPDFNARALLKTLGLDAPRTADPRALTRLGLTASLAGSRNDISFDPLNLVLDDTNVTGTLNLANLSAPIPAARFDLRVNGIDADRYLPPQSKAQPATPGAAAAVIPVDTLRALDVDGKVQIDRLKINRLNLSDVQIALSGKDGLVRLHPAQARLYQGTYSGNVQVDARGKLPVISVDERLQEVQAGPLLQDLQGRADLTGIANVAARLSATGVDEAALKRSASGEARARVVNGSIRGVDILGDLCKLLATADIGSVADNPLGALFGLASSRAQPGANETRFTEMSVSAQFKDGVAYSDDLDLRSPALRVGGKGKLLLDQMFLDYLAEPAIVSSCQGQGGQSFRELAGVPLPIQIKGVLPDIKSYPKFGRAVVQTLTRSRQRTTTQAAPTQPAQQPTQPQKPEDVLKDAGKKAVGDLLRGILKQ